MSENETRADLIAKWGKCPICWEPNEPKMVHLPDGSTVVRHDCPEEGEPDMRPPHTFTITAADLRQADE